MMKKYLPLLLLPGLLLFFSEKAFACHGTALVNVTITQNATDITINANSDPATCGCGPYYMEAEVIPASANFNGNPPLYTSASWGTAPWFHSLLNVPNYTAANGWPDNCALEPYNPLVIPFSGLCPGTNYKFRIREIAAGGGSAGSWSTPQTFTTPGPAATASLNPIAFPDTICQGGSTLLDAFGGSCAGSGTFTWSPAAGLSNPNAYSTSASPTVTTTYSITYFDPSTSTTYTASVTVTVAPPLSGLISVIESGCGMNNGYFSASGSGGVSPYTFLWLPTNDTTSSIGPMSTSAYDVTITDAIGCSVHLTGLAADSCDLVWPGDANDDSLADNFDLVAIGIAYGDTETTRQSNSLAWNGYPSRPWAMSFMSGSNYKHADCNGDGMVDMNDTTAVLLNYGLYHLFREGIPVYNTSLPDFYITFLDDSVPSGGGIGLATINLGSAALPATGVYGLAFTVNYDPTYIDAASVQSWAVNSWLGNPGANLFLADYNDSLGHLDIGITRIDHQDQSGYGQIAAIYYRTSSSLNGSGNSAFTPFSISNPRIVSFNESPVQVNQLSDSVKVYDTPTGAGNPGQPGDLQVYPNPAYGIFNLSYLDKTGEVSAIEIQNSLGQVIYSEQVPAQAGFVNRQIDLSAQPRGVYFVKVYGNGGSGTIKLLLR